MALGTLSPPRCRWFSEEAPQCTQPPLQLYPGPCLTHHTPPGAGRDPPPSRSLSGTIESIILPFSSHPQRSLAPACQRMGCTSNRHMSQHSKQETTLCPDRGFHGYRERFHVLSLTPGCTPMSSHTQHSSRLISCGWSLLMVPCLRKV